MLTIRSEQMRALQAARFEEFERYTLAHVQAHLPEYAEVTTDLAATVRLGVSRGVRHITAEGDVARYVEIVLRYMGGFTNDDHPQRALEMIASRALPAQQRLANFERWAKKRGRIHAG